MNCKCLSETDEKLKDKNLEITACALVFSTGKTRFTIATGWIDAGKAPKGQKKNPPSMLASFCPFCGVKAD